MDQPKALLQSDRTLLIGVLANLSAGFLSPPVDDGDAGNRFEQMMERYRADLGEQLGHVPSDGECHQALEGQVHRVRVSIGEYS